MRVPPRTKRQVCHSNKRGGVQTSTPPKNQEWIDLGCCLGGWPIFALPIPAEGDPSLRFLQGRAAMQPAQLLSLPHSRCGCRRSYPPLRLRSGEALRKVREGRGPRCGGFCSLKAGPPAENANEWRENCVRRWKCPTQARGRLEWATRLSGKPGGACAPPRKTMPLTEPSLLSRGTGSLELYFLGRDSGGTRPARR